MNDLNQLGMEAIRSFSAILISNMIEKTNGNNNNIIYKVACSPQ